MENEIEGLLKRYGVLKQGHFKLTSGLHSASYFEKFRILEHPDLVTLFAARIARRFFDQRITVVCGPTTGGIIIAFEVARQMQTRCVIAEKNEAGGRKIGRGFQIGESDRILVVDDVLTTGGSITETLEALKAFPGQGELAHLAGIAVFIDRSEKPPFALPHFAVYRQAVQNFKPEECLLCRQGIPLSVSGSTGKK